MTGSVLVGTEIAIIRSKIATLSAGIRSEKNMHSPKG